MKKWVMFIAILLMLVFVQTVSAGTVENGFVPPNVCHKPSDMFIGFEDGTNLAAVTNQYPGLLFSIPGGTNWIYLNHVTGSWNYPMYYWDGAVSITPDLFQSPSNSGRIDFTEGTASYVSVLTGGVTATMDAYDSSNTQIDTSGASSNNLGTNTMARLTVQKPGISYVLIHDTNSFWEIDDLCTDAPSGQPSQAVPEFPTLAIPIGFLISLIGVVFLVKFQRR
jgi:hypothetical protein